MRLLPLLLLLSSCTHSPSHWQLDAIAAGDSAYDSARLRSLNPNADSPLTFELLKMGNQIEAFLSLTHFQLTPDKETPSLTTVSFFIENENFTEQVPLLEGRMRIRLSLETTERVTQALQEGKKVSILLGSFEKTLDPEQFSQVFARFKGSLPFLQNFLKGPLQ